MAQAWRLRLIAGILALLTLVLVLRLMDMQIRSWRDFLPRGGNVSARFTVDDSTPWGVIVDRNGVLLAADRYLYRITATPIHITPEQRIEVAEMLANVAGIPAQQTWQRLTDNAERSYAVLATDVDFQTGRTLLREKNRQLTEGDALLAHVQIQARPRRFYPQGSLASQVIGFLNAERRPVLGVERYYSSFLPTDGVGLPRGQKYTRESINPEALRFIPQGQEKGLILTIDRGVQWIIEEELREGVRLYGAESGSIIVMEPHTGAVLGIANFPTFDPNGYENADLLAFNNAAVSAQYEPGSIFKVITMAAGLDAGVVEGTTIMTDTGTIVVGGRTIQNSSRQAFGAMAVGDALAQSNNVITVQVAELLGAKQFYDYLARFGFGADTHIDLSGEIPGLVKKPGDLAWSLSDLATNSFGQGVAVTPIQMTTSIAAIVNGGNLMRPYVVQARVHGEQAFIVEPTVLYPVIKPETAQDMIDMMVHTVETGNQLARVPGYTVGGKSGTAEVATAAGYSSEETIASFVGFAPADQPAFVVLVKLDKPDLSISRWAAQSAAPIFSRVSYRLLNYYDIPPDGVRLRQAER
jgi:cell division protein FtsI/penicillin-binding protein 2